MSARGLDPAPRFDLQAHSTHSDGSLHPRDVVREAQASGVELLALSDHDSVGGVEEALSAGRSLGVTVVPAVEVSAIHGGHEDLHILGYGIDHRATDLLAALEEYRQDRLARADRMGAALRGLGFGLDEQVLERRRRSGASIGRPHLARAVFEHPGNGERLAREGLTSPEVVLQAYLLPGRPAFRGRTAPSVRDAIAVIHAAGGVAVWAHPFWDIDDPAEVLQTAETFVGYGLDGIESFYVTHDPMEVQLLHDACRALDLLSTGSSDFHGPGHTLFSAFRRHSLHGLEPNLGDIPRRAAAAVQT